MNGMALIINSKTKLTYKEYVQFPDDGKRHEIIDGDHYVTPVPETNHQRVSRLIQFQLMQQIEMRGLGEIYNAPTDLQFSDVDIVQPDLIVVLKRHRQIITPKKIKGVPDLVVEIVSPFSEDRDRGLKRELYQRSGVPEYWLVDAGEHAVEQYVLEGGAYILAAKESKEISFRQVPGVVVDLTAVW
jgi:Uma2 family endonuclease